MIHILNGDSDDRETRLADLNRPMPDDVRRAKALRRADDAAREGAINALDAHAERNRLDTAWAEQRREVMKVRFRAQREAEERGEDLVLLDPPPMTRPDGWKPEGQHVERTTKTYTLTGDEVQSLFGFKPADDPETIPATADLGTILGVPRKAKPQPTPEEALRAQERSVETVRAKFNALLRRKEREEVAGGDVS